MEVWHGVMVQLSLDRCHSAPSGSSQALGRVQEFCGNGGKRSVGGRGVKYIRGNFTQLTNLNSEGRNETEPTTRDAARD